jgi:RNA recognition motif-containing protein
VCAAQQGIRMKKTYDNPMQKDSTIGELQHYANMSTIYVGNLRYNKKENDIQKMFGKFGKVSYVKIVKDQETNKSKGFAFVQMRAKPALQAIQNLDGKQVDGRTLKVSIAQDNKDAEAKPVKVRTSKKELVAKKVIKKKREKGLKVLMDYLHN